MKRKCILGTALVLPIVTAVASCFCADPLPTTYNPLNVGSCYTVSTGGSLQVLSFSGGSTYYSSYACDADGYDVYDLGATYGPKAVSAFYTVLRFNSSNNCSGFGAVIPWQQNGTKNSYDPSGLDEDCGNS